MISNIPSSIKLSISPTCLVQSYLRIRCYMEAQGSEIAAVGAGAELCNWSTGTPLSHRMLNWCLVKRVQLVKSSGGLSPRLLPQSCRIGTRDAAFPAFESDAIRSPVVFLKDNSPSSSNVFSKSYTKIHARCLEHNLCMRP